MGSALPADLVQLRHARRTRHDAINATLKKLEGTDAQRRIEAMVNLKKILLNASESESQPKYRTLMKANRIMSGKILSVPGCFEFLLLAGFEDKGDKLELVSACFLKEAHSRLTAFEKEQSLNEKRLERDATIAALQAKDK